MTGATHSAHRAGSLELTIAAIYALGQLANPFAFEGLADANVRFAAYEALGLLPVQKGAFALDQGLSDPVENGRVAAAGAIDRNYRRQFDKAVLPMVMVTTQNQTQDNEAAYAAGVKQSCTNLPRPRIWARC